MLSLVFAFSYLSSLSPSASSIPKSFVHIHVEVLMLSPFFAFPHFFALFLSSFHILKSSMQNVEALISLPFLHILHISALSFSINHIPKMFYVECRGFHATSFPFLPSHYGLLHPAFSFHFYIMHSHILHSHILLLHFSFSFHIRSMDVETIIV